MPHTDRITLNISPTETLALTASRIDVIKFVVPSRLSLTNAIASAARTDLVVSWTNQVDLAVVSPLRDQHGIDHH